MGRQAARRFAAPVHGVRETHWLGMPGCALHVDIDAVALQADHSRNVSRFTIDE